MDRDHRNRWLERIHAEAADVSLLRHLNREYDLNDIAIMTRAAPARLLGLPDRGHLGIDAVADVAVYDEQDDKAAMFARAHLVFKDGIQVVEQGRVIDKTRGRVHAVAPAFATSIEHTVSDYFNRYHMITAANFTLGADQLGETLGSELVLH
jgi:formylmethanofuran dehydrogenase subunit A